MAAPRALSPIDPPVRVVVIDSHRLFAELLSAVLRTQSDLTCVARAFSASEGRDAVAEHRPDVVVIDVDLAGVDGVALAAALIAQNRDLRVIVVTGEAGVASFRAAALAGVCAYVSKLSPLEDILDAIRSSRPGTMRAPVDLITLAAHPETAPPDAGLDLSPRLHEVLSLLGDGHTVHQISRRLGLSIHTTRGYVKTILARLEAHSQLEAVAIAKRRGLMPTAS
jgi:DNA-binding NarL/FixJ family response regulator